MRLIDAIRLGVLAAAIITGLAIRPPLEQELNSLLDQGWTIIDPEGHEVDYFTLGGEVEE
jgi:hypothetical protein